MAGSMDPVVVKESVISSSSEAWLANKVSTADYLAEALREAEAEAEADVERQVEPAGA